MTRETHLSVLFCILALVVILSPVIVSAETLIIDNSAWTNHSAPFGIVGYYPDSYHSPVQTDDGEFITIQGYGIQNITKLTVYLYSASLTANRMYYDLYGTNEGYPYNMVLLVSGYTTQPDIGVVSGRNLTFYEPLNVSMYNGLFLVARPYYVEYPALRIAYSYNHTNDPFVNGSMYYFDAGWNQMDYQNQYYDMSFRVYGNLNESFEPTPTPTPPPPSTPTPTPTPTPTTTPISSNYTNYTYNYTDQAGWEEYSEGVVSGWNDTVGDISGVSDVPLQNLRSGVQSLNSSLGNYSYADSMPFLLVVIPAFVGALPSEFIALITLSLVFMVILTVMRRK